VVYQKVVQKEQFEEKLSSNCQSLFLYQKFYMN